MKRTKTRIILAVGALMLSAVYVVLPVLAGYHRIGKRDGPKIYFRDFHIELYKLGWEMNDQNIGKPRAEFYRPRPPRPWFYDFNDRRPPG